MSSNPSHPLFVLHHLLSLKLFGLGELGLACRTFQFHQNYLMIYFLLWLDLASLHPEDILFSIKCVKHTTGLNVFMASNNDNIRDVDSTAGSVLSSDAGASSDGGAGI